MTSVVTDEVKSREQDSKQSDAAHGDGTRSGVQPVIYAVRLMNRMSGESQPECVGPETRGTLQLPHRQSASRSLSQFS